MFLQLAETVQGGGEDTVVRISWNIYAWFCEQIGAGTNLRMVLMVVSAVLCIVIPYLLGSINPAIILSKLIYHEDIRSYGSGNAGTTNVLRTYGKKMAVITLICDLLKAAVAVIFGMLMLTLQYGGAIAGFFVIFGHSFPVFYKFKGGKGVACTAMVVLLLSPLTFVILLFIFAIIVIFTKYVSLASVMGVALYPLISTAFLQSRDDKGGFIPAFAVLTALLVIFMHRENLKRLFEGKESKISFRKTDKHKKGDNGESMENKPPETSTREYKDSDFTKCTGCGQIIPVSREKCVYCGEKNPKYVPKSIDPGKDVKSRKHGRKNK